MNPHPTGLRVRAGTCCAALPMHRVGSQGATTKTQEMMLDSFMQGFIFKLFEQKWHKFARRLYQFFLSKKR
jgi:hypothetical protein